MEQMQEQTLENLMSFVIASPAIYKNIIDIFLVLSRITDMLTTKLLLHVLTHHFGLLNKVHFCVQAMPNDRIKRRRIIIVTMLKQENVNWHYEKRNY